MSKTHIREAVLSDAPILAQIRCEAFVRDPIIEWIDFQDAKEFESRWKHAHVSQTSHTFVATENKSDAPIGFIQYKTHEVPTQFALPRGPNDSVESIELLEVTGERKRTADLARKLISVTAKDNLKHVDKYIYISFLAISPKFQHRGIGKALMSRVLAVAQQYNAQCYLESSDVGLPFYQSLGWTLLDEEKHVRLIDDEAKVKSVTIPVLIWRENK